LRIFYFKNKLYSKYNAECNNTVREHPTQKPVELLKIIIQNFSKKGMTILDNTMGSGSTGVAAKMLNRNFIGIEKDLEYYKISESRILCGGELL